MTFVEFFTKLTGYPPFPYQERLGLEPWPALLDIPTGLGKTAAVSLAWMYKRLQGDNETGTRLVYCLPMRVLVAQTRDNAEAWCETAAPYFEEAGRRGPRVHVLMGGDVDASWESEPECPAIVVGTQDMLLSRALNRGYAMSRYKWPVHFSLLNNDCLWVFDETQLIGVGIETSAQLQGFREKLGAHRGTRSVWMSATLSADQLATVDHRRPAEGWLTHSLTPEDASHDIVRRRTGAAKPVARLTACRLDKDSDKKGYIEALARAVLEEHERRKGLTLVIVNRVPRAQALFKALRATEGRDDSNTALVHARFRPADRDEQERLLQAERERVVVATQAVEAGVDVSARTLITELAPWASLVQRFGRCNRYGGEDAAIFWVDVDTHDEKSGLGLPYDMEALNDARSHLGKLEEMGADAGPQRLEEITYEPPAVVRPVLRRRDLLDLFDTTPDLCGNDLDVSRYVRDGEDTDVQLFWRVFEGVPTAQAPAPSRQELCRVSVAAARDFIKKLHGKRAKGSGSDKDKRNQFTAWQWNPLERQWESAGAVRPGQVFLLHATAGGYDTSLGWTGEVAPKTAVPVVEAPVEDDMAADAMEADRTTQIGRWVRLDDHLAHVRDEARHLAEELGLADRFGDTLATAGLWHDVGKAHDAFQRKLLDPVRDRPDLLPQGSGPWAKSNHRLYAAPERTHFRHELASALAYLRAGAAEDARAEALIAYLVAAHHGKVRLSLRSVPGEAQPPEAARLFARGVWDGDILQAFDLPNGQRLEGVELDLSIIQLGAGSWLERMLELRDDDTLGPFRLALLETAVRVADWRASRKEQEGNYDG